MTRVMYRPFIILFLFVGLLTTAHAGAPASITRKLRVLEITHCGPLTLENIHQVRNFYVYPNGTRPEGEIPENALRDNPGIVVEAKIIRTRDITYPFMDFSGRVSATAWRETPDPHTELFFIYSSSGINCADLINKKRINVTVGDGMSGCDLSYCGGSYQFKQTLGLVDDAKWQEYEKIAADRPSVMIDGKRHILTEHGKLAVERDPK